MRRPQSQAEKRYVRLKASLSDFAHAGFCVRHLVKKKWHRHPWEARGTTYYQQAAYTTAAIVAYLRPFGESRGGLPRLPDDLIKRSEAESEIHHRLKMLRNQIYAHSDGAHYNYQPWADGEVGGDICFEPMFRLSEADAAVLLGLLDKLSGAIQVEISQLSKEIPNL